MIDSIETASTHHIRIMHYYANDLCSSRLNFRGYAGGSSNYYWGALFENPKKQKLKTVVLLRQMFLEQVIIFMTLDCLYLSTRMLF